MRRGVAAALAALVLAFSITGHAAAGPFEDGVAAHEREDYATAFRLWRSLGDQGDARAQFNLGVMYDNGQSVPRNYTEAAKWYRKAADQGVADAQFNLGVMYERGKGAPQDYAEAMKWYRKAADQGDASAQYNLGVMHDDGQGVPQNYTEAAKWYRKAADQGDASAQANLGALYFKGRGVLQDYVEAVKWRRKAAEQGNALAQAALGIMYDSGEGVAQDRIEASRWLRKAADQGYTLAQSALGYRYFSGEGVLQDYTEAAKWYRKAANQGVASAQFSLGTMYERGWGVPKDHVLSHMWFNLSAAQGDKKASSWRDQVATEMTPGQIAEAQRLAREWKPSLDTSGLRAVVPAPSATEARNDSILVAEAQRLLARLGFQPGPADGIAGRGTVSVVSAYQKKRGLSPDGKITEALVALMREDAARAAPAQTAQAPRESDWITFRNSEFRFRFIYPPDWRLATPRGANVRGSINAPQGGPFANCNIVVRNVPELSNYSQSQLNDDISQNPFTPNDWAEVLGEKFADTAILEAKPSKIDNQPAQYAVLSFTYETTQGKIWAQGMNVITLTPGKFWHYGCMAGGASPADARAGYEKFRPVLSRIMSSLVFERW